MGLMARVDKVATQRQQGVPSGMLQTEALPSSPGRSSCWGVQGGRDASWPPTASASLSFCSEWSWSTSPTVY